MSVDGDILELYRRVQALEANLSSFTSIAKLGDTPLTGAVTLSEGANIVLTEAGQDIQIAAFGAPYYWARFTDEDTVSQPVWLNPGGRSYRIRTWQLGGGFTQVLHNGPGFVGYGNSVTPDGITIELLGTYLVTVNVQATFPAQQEIRQAGVFIEFGGGGPADPQTSDFNSSFRTFDLSVASPPGTDTEQTFSTTFMVTGPFPQVPVFFLFGEDDINNSRTTTLSSGWTLEVLAIQLT